MGGWRNGSASDSSDLAVLSQIWRFLKVTGSNPVSLIFFYFFFRARRFSSVSVINVKNCRNMPHFYIVRDVGVRPTSYRANGSGILINAPLSVRPSVAPLLDLASYGKHGYGYSIVLILGILSNDQNRVPTVYQTNYGFTRLFI